MRGAGGGTGEDGDGTGGMDGSGGGSGSGGTSVTPARTCSYDADELRLCIEFEDGRFDPMVSDASDAQLDVPAIDVGATNRASFKAAAFAWTSRISVGESMALDIGGAISIEAWVGVTFDQSENLVENTNQYSVGITDSGRVVCRIGGATLSSYDSAKIALYTFNHVACIYDGASLSVYLNGKLAGTQPLTVGAPTGAMNGTRIGGNGFIGAIDDIRIYAKALSLSEVCRRATGQDACTPFTPTDGGNSGPSGRDSGP